MASKTPVYDDKCYVYATLDATPGCEQLPAIGLIAHMDTTPDMTGKDVKPQIIHYDRRGRGAEPGAEHRHGGRPVPGAAESSWVRSWSAPTAPPCWGRMTRRASPSSSRRWRSCWQRRRAPRQDLPGLHPGRGDRHGRQLLRCIRLRRGLCLYPGRRRYHRL